MYSRVRINCTAASEHADNNNYVDIVQITLTIGKSESNDFVSKLDVEFTRNRITVQHMNNKRLVIPSAIISYAVFRARQKRLFTAKCI